MGCKGSCHHTSKDNMDHQGRWAHAPQSKHALKHPLDVKHGAATGKPLFIDIVSD